MRAQPMWMVRDSKHQSHRGAYRRRGLGVLDLKRRMKQSDHGIGKGVAVMVRGIHGAERG